MITKHKFVITLGDKTIFAQEDATWTVRDAAIKFIVEHLKTPLQFEAVLDDTLISSKADSVSWPLKTTIENTIKQLFANRLCGEGRIAYDSNVGDKGSAKVSALRVDWVCTYKGRRPARPKHVIAAENARLAGKRAARQAEKDKWVAEAAQRVVNIRERIKRQVDHAFALGKHGTEPAAKYITCQHCDGPAAVVCLNQPLARGAAVLDEATIVGACCANHIQNAPYSYYTRYGRNGNVTQVPCTKLEFFYDGIRQIAIKA